MVFVGVASFLVGGRGEIALWPLAVVVLAGAAGSAGANAASCWFDRDMDTIMTRTRERPLPAGRINPPVRALHLGLALMALALALSATLGPWAVAFMLLGELDYVLVYSVLLKRRSRWNILWGSLSGGAPAMFGWVAATGSVGWAPLLMAALVVLWIPSHIWTLAMYYADDYRRAQVPMMPAVDLKKAARCLACTAVLALLASLALGPVAGPGRLYLITALIAGAVLAGGNLALALRPSRRAARLLFKLSSPYLVVVFTAMAVDAMG